MPGSIKILRAGPQDLFAARQAVAEIHERTPVDNAALNAFLNDSSCYLLLAVEGDTAVGSLNGYALRNPDRRAPQFLLYEIDVRPKYRRRGIATSLLEAFAIEAQTAGAHEIWVVSNESSEGAIELYLKCGYSRPNSDDAMLLRTISS